MKKVLVICGTGIATSTIVIEKLKKWLMQEKLIDQVELHQGKVAEAVDQRKDYDFIVSTTIVPDYMKEHVIDGVPLLSGVDVDEVYQSIRERI
ncbi:PTS sugar transporter subunit IIB [Virgibacillus xinjiangensis]|uniref:PTS sugar transporter subunit IIB n=1 Tax=Virgibacillus xinjiangensis TaxID=393090 RepID=A0ABV7CWP6_9BACI